jgi:hypothetical protein
MSATSSVSPVQSNLKPTPNMPQQLEKKLAAAVDPRQERRMRFNELLRRTDWPDSEAAKRLGLSKGYVYMLRHPEKYPDRFPKQSVVENLETKLSQIHRERVEIDDTLIRLEAEGHNNFAASLRLVLRTCSVTQQHRIFNILQNVLAGLVDTKEEAPGGSPLPSKISKVSRKGHDLFVEA